ncbi:MAG: RimK family protein, partial [Opitutales bacterium]
MPTPNLLVVNTPARWKLPVDTVEVVSARDYLAPDFTRRFPQARVFNLCRSYAYQSLGYYVSLLAEARGHRAIPAVATLRDFRSAPIARSMGEEISEVIQGALKGVEGTKFELDVYFGQTLARAHQRLGAQIYRLFPAPLLRARFRREERWVLVSVAPLTVTQLPAAERDTLTAHARTYFQKKHNPKVPKQRFIYDLAILVNPDEPHPPSNAGALKKLAEAAREVGFYVEMITTADADRISEFDALFIRETTAVDHATYRLARLAHAEGLIVIDDPWSILRCANKIYLAELLNRAKLPAPPTWILTKEDLEPARLAQLPLPCILKAPDAAFSVGVKKAETRETLAALLGEMLKASELILAQAFTPSEFDWRIGILDHQPLFACKYYMASGHWQIYNWAAQGKDAQLGDSETMHVEFAPPAVVETALKAARLIGDGLYGVDLKQRGNEVFIIEVNDNPNIDEGIED